MIIQFILALTFLMVLGFALMQRQYSRFVSTVIAGLSTVGIVFSLIPDLSTMIANLMGVSRGVDLALYFYVPISIFLILHLNAKMRQQQQGVTELVRKIALMDAGRRSDD